MRNPIVYGFKIHSRREGYLFILGYFGMQKDTSKLQSHQKVCENLRIFLTTKTLLKIYVKLNAAVHPSTKYSILIPLLKHRRLNKQLQS